MRQWFLLGWLRLIDAGLSLGISGLERGSLLILMFLSIKDMAPLAPFAAEAADDM